MGFLIMTVFCAIANQNKAPFILPNLPYAIDALVPYYSKHLFELHHGKHHAAYVTNLNNLLPSSEFENKSLEEIMIATSGDASKAGFFNNAAQIWNHTFFWHCMKPNGGGAPTGEVAALIDSNFGSFAEFKKQFIEKATKLFGSGWTWLAIKDNKLTIEQTSNAENPLTKGLKPILTVDVWEHAYYVDYENRRAEFVEKFFDHLVNWDFVNNVLTCVCSSVKE